MLRNIFAFTVDYCVGIDLLNDHTRHLIYADPYYDCRIETTSLSCLNIAMRVKIHAFDLKTNIDAEFPTEMDTALNTSAPRHSKHIARSRNLGFYFQRIEMQQDSMLWFGPSISCLGQRGNKFYGE